MRELPEEVKKLHDCRIKALVDYFGISDTAAEYIYFRRKRGFPWKKKDDPKYIEWSDKLLNALREADKIFGFDWSGLTFGNEDRYLENYGIIVDDMDDGILCLNNDFQEWTIATNKKKATNLLKKIGIIPKKKLPIISNKLLSDKYK
jgi:hypothetical protein